MTTEANRCATRKTSVHKLEPVTVKDNYISNAKMAVIDKDKLIVTTRYQTLPSGNNA